MSYVNDTFFKTILALSAGGHPNFVAKLPYKSSFLKRIKREVQEKEDDLIFILRILLDLVVWLAGGARATRRKTVPTFSVTRAEVDGVSGAIVKTKSIQTFQEPRMRGEISYMETVTKEVVEERFYPYFDPKALPEDLAAMAHAITQTILDEEKFEQFSELLKQAIVFIVRKILKYTRPDKDIIDLTSSLISQLKPQPDNYDPPEDTSDETY